MFKIAGWTVVAMCPACPQNLLAATWMYYFLDCAFIFNGGTSFDLLNEAVIFKKRIFVRAFINMCQLVCGFGVVEGEDHCACLDFATRRLKVDHQ